MRWGDGKQRFHELVRVFLCKHFPLVQIRDICLKLEVNLALKFSINSVLFVLINPRSMKFLIMREKVC